MTLYRVDVTEHRTWIIYVEADSQAEAESEAEELAASFDADDYQTDSYAYAHTPNDESAEVWVGGEDGEWISHAEYKRRQGDA